MSTNLGPLVQPNLRSLLDSERAITLANINCCKVGAVQSFDPESQSVTVLLVNQRVVFNTPMDSSLIPPSPTIYSYPLLVDVPLFVLSGGSAFIGMPIVPGDPCLVLFNDSDLDPWWSNGAIGSPPNSSRTHSLADGFALVGVRAANDAIPSLPSDGTIRIGNASGTLGLVLIALLTALEAWVNTDSTTPNSTTLAALAAVKTAINAILS